MFATVFSRRWVRVLTILLAGIAAHGGCLRATFYSDDWWQIFDSEYVEGGQWWAEPTLTLTHLSYFVTWRLAGFSTFAFHLGNLALHLLFALSIYWLARYLFAVRADDGPARWETAAWLSALIFVVHPLTTEVTHYARARDHAMVGWFSFLAAGFTALAVRRDWRWTFPAAAAILCATFSKGPGLPHALLSGALVTLGFLRNARWRTLLTPRRWLLATPVALGVLALTFGHVKTLAGILVAQVATPFFPQHALTQCRVFPHYLWRMVLPLDLCSDHLFAWATTLTDVAAWGWAVLVVGMIVLAVFLWWRGAQPVALLFALALAPLLLRWFFIAPTLMVEYRAYPSMPFVAMLMAVALIWWQRRQRRLAVGAASALILFYTLLSHWRSDDWRTPETLCAQTLRLYPLQLAAMNDLSLADLHAGRAEAIIGRTDDFTRRVNDVLAYNRSHPQRPYTSWLNWIVNEECAKADALARTQGSAAARRFLDMTAWRLNRFGADSPRVWGRWHFEAGRVALQAGDHRAALRHFVLARGNVSRTLPVDREIQKIVPAAALVP